MHMLKVVEQLLLKIMLTAKVFIRLLQVQLHMLKVLLIGQIEIMIILKLGRLVEDHMRKALKHKQKKKQLIVKDIEQKQQDLEHTQKDMKQSHQEINLMPVDEEHMQTK